MVGGAGGVFVAIAFQFSLVNNVVIYIMVWFGSV
jgi:hypothetical protein